MMADSSTVTNSLTELSPTKTTNLAILVNGATSSNSRPRSAPRNSASPKSVGSNESQGTASSTASQIALGSPLEPSSAEESDDPLSGDVPDRRLDKRPLTLLRTGLCYDARMRFHTELDPGKDHSDYHPEDPRRIYFIYRTLCRAGLIEDDMTIPPLVQNPVRRILARPATKAEICLVHNESHFEWMKSTAALKNSELLMQERKLDSIYLHPLTYTSALLSAGAAIETALAVASGKVQNAIAVIRPPGHHAEADCSKGFCHFDNVSVATKVVRQTYPEQCRKIMIVDWDVHHGNGIQQAFESEPNVLYISIHVHENGMFYPAGPYGDMYHCGIGAGVGRNINIPWPIKGMGDADYLFAFQHVIMPVAFDFNPDLVMIAAGFDAAIGDQLGGCFVSPACYAHMTHMLMSVAKGKLVVCLEGGYNLRSISNSSLAVTRTLMGEPPDRLAETAATPAGIITIRQVIKQQAKFWRCLYPKNISADIAALPSAERMHDVIRAYQAKNLQATYKMISLTVFRERISKSFENQVLATLNYHLEVPLLVIFHDPPEMIGTPDPITSKLDLHNSWLTDGLKNYIAWAVKNRFGVIDVNIPKFLTGISDPEGDEEEEALKVKVATEELATYLWDNYIECNDSTKVLFLGVGEAFRAVLHILNTRNYEALEQIAGVVAFFGDQPLRPVTESFITDFSKWYYRNSLFFVSPTHLVWNRDKRPSKKFGMLKQAGAEGLNEMLGMHSEEVEQFLLKKAGVLSEKADAVMTGNGR